MSTPLHFYRLVSRTLNIVQSGPLFSRTLAAQSIKMTLANQTDEGDTCAEEKAYVDESHNGSCQNIAVLQTIFKDVCSRDGLERVNNVAVRALATSVAEEEIKS